MSNSSIIHRPATDARAKQQQDRDTLILSYLAHMSGMLRNFSLSAQMEYEDLQQDAVLVIMHCLDLRPQEEAGRLHGYINWSVRNRIIDRIRCKHPTLSLDAPLLLGGGGEGTTFAELLPDDYNLDPLAVVILQEQLDRFCTWIQTSKTSHWKPRVVRRDAYRKFLKQEEGQAG